MIEPIYALNLGENFEPCYFCDRDEAIKACDSQIETESAYVEEVTSIELESDRELLCRALNHDSWINRSRIIHESPVGSQIYFWHHEYRHYMRPAPPLSVLLSERL